MAKRKRLSAANPMFLDAPEGPAPALRTAPIADVARDASQAAAAEELARTLTEAREGGRMVVEVPLEKIQLDYLVRDRIAVDDEEMAALRQSLKARGQQTPVELVDLGGGHYGLISGWRRCQALQTLRAETDDPRFGVVLALVRRPAESSDAYVAMVEENEIRVGLSYYERARIVVKAVERGVFETDRAGLQGLFANASRPRRSKIGSFMGIVRALDGALRFPQAIPERFGLTLAKSLQARPELAEAVSEALQADPPETAEAEAAVLQALMLAKPAKRPASAKAAPPGLTVKTGKGKVTLTGASVTPDLVEDLTQWLRVRGVLGE